MSDDDQLVVSANRRFLWGCAGFCLVVEVVGAYGVLFAGSTTRVLLALALIGGLFGVVLTTLRFRMARYPQLVADENGFAVATLFTRRSFTWEDLESIEPLKTSSVWGPVRERRWTPADALFGGTPRMFRFRAGGRTYGVIAANGTTDAGEKIRARFESMWRAYSSV